MCAITLETECGLAPLLLIVAKSVAQSPAMHLKRFVQILPKLCCLLCALWQEESHSLSASPASRRVGAPSPFSDTHQSIRADCDNTASADGGWEGWSGKGRGRGRGRRLPPHLRTAPQMMRLTTVMATANTIIRMQIFFRELRW